jgi:hypothetical protein
MSNDKKTSKGGQRAGISRRQFIVNGALAAGVAAVSGCARDKEDQNREHPVPTDKMTYRTDPRTKDKISLLGYGCMRLPVLPKGESLPGNNNIDQEAVNASVDYALAHGVNYFDTSPMYCKGFSERATGIALSRHFRETYFIATKLSNFRACGREDSLAMYRNSFKELQVSHIDYYLLHALGLGGMENFKARYIDNGALDFLLKEKEAGRIRNLGWSFHGDVKVFDYLLEMGIPWDFVQIQLNYVDWETPQGANTVTARYLYEALERKNIPAIIMEPNLGGRLARLHYKAQELLKQAEPELSAASWAFRFAGSFSNVLTVLSGMTFMEHLQDNVCTYSPLKPVNAADMELLNRAAKFIAQFQNIMCTSCQYCMPCPYGIDIPGVFDHYNRCLNEGNFPDNVQDPNYRKARRAFLIELDRNVEKLRQTNHCTGCGLCAKECPQHIRIPREMAGWTSS